MYRCRQCCTAFVHPMPTREALDRFYAGYHRPDAEGGWYDEVESRMQADFASKVDLVRRFAGADPGRVLDLGCGKGFFVKACIDRGIRAEGLDLSASAVEYARTQLRVPVTQGFLHDVKDALGRFNAVTFWATIEHTSDPLGTLRDVYDLLEAGGYLLLDTGIGNDWLDRLLPGTVQWYDPPQHLFVFSEQGIRAALRSSGFSVVALTRCFERSRMRKVARLVRNAGAAAALRLIAAACQLRHGRFAFTRFALGNLMSVVARRP